MPGILVAVTEAVAGELVPQLLIAETEMVPEVLPANTVICVVPWPLVTIEPSGASQLYEVAPFTLEIE